MELSYTLHPNPNFNPNPDLTMRKVKPLSRAKSSNSCDADHSDNNSETTFNESETLSPRSEASSTASNKKGSKNMTYEKMNKMMNASFGKGNTADV